jgi:AcrR family transcriptional regulator
MARDARRQAILDIARDVFITEGFAATSMSAIAARLGGSKGTLYNYFRSKEELFEAIMREACGGEAEAMAAIAQGGDLPDVLRNIGERFVRFVTSDDAVGVYRLVFAESQRFPELGMLFWDNGPRLTLKVVSVYLAAQMDAGALRRDDPERCAGHLMSMFKANLQQAVIWNIRGPLTDAEITEHVACAVEAFLHGYGMDAPAAA